MTTTNRKDCYTEITNAIIADLEKGIRPWVKPWTTGAMNPTRPLRHTGEPYRGINVLWLWRAADLAGYTRPHWFTYRQAQELGGQVRKGEKSTLVVYANLYTKTEDDDAREPEEKRFPFLKAYSVFNADQSTTSPSDSPRHRPPPQPATPTRRTTGPSSFSLPPARTSARTRRRTATACSKTPFSCPRSGCSSGRTATTRLSPTNSPTGPGTRSEPRASFPKASYSPATYAREELVAELGAAFLCADLGINLTPRQDHADYIGNWLQVLRNDKRAIFQAASYAQKAADYLHGLQPSAIRHAA